MMKAVTNYYALNITPQLYAFSLSEDHFNSIPKIPDVKAALSTKKTNYWCAFLIFFLPKVTLFIFIFCKKLSSDIDTFICISDNSAELRSTIFTIKFITKFVWLLFILFRSIERLVKQS